MSHFKGRHPECRECKHFRPNLGSVHCLNCGAGEFFEERIESGQPSDTELMEMYRLMEIQNDE